MDVLVGFGVIAVLYGALRLGESMSVTITPGASSKTISTSVADVPYYAARSLVRMFIALAASTIFTFVYGTAAARLRRAEKVMIPLLDIL